ncbi:M14 family zinc carboxypeptidase [Facklamia languida]|uniref:Uncharacterized protein n=1 Tax=Facklamia languida CCUG 37842 TaxID=883113 RepID=H3NIF9_9LACT|nr:M14 family zinc carboxypeptidase [Facklamia languida]EHR37469.1 hypothetical protein HMPREF9708_00648 [Facklamia languida CCUG 37842]
MIEMVEEILTTIPDYKEFLTVEEMDENTLRLAEEYPDIVKVKIAGHSRNGHPIYLLTIGSGKYDAMLYGCPHPNEPIGAMMLEFLSNELATNADLRISSDYTWHIIKCIDVDGTKLNEGWFKGELTLTRYARDFFRPAAYEQVEWTYPFEYKDYKFDSPLPETKILMNLIDEIKPDFVYGLHNAGFGGTYWYINNELPDLWEDFYNASSRQGLPLHLGEPEVSFIKPYAPAIFPFISSKDTYDHYEKYGDESPAQMMANSGGSTESYIADSGLNSYFLVTELPYFYDERIDSEKEMNITRKESILSGIEISQTVNSLIGDKMDVIDSCISDENPFYKMVKQEQMYSKKGLSAEINYINDNEEYNQPCKESEYLDSNIIRRFYTLLSLSLAIRSCEYEIRKGNSNEIIKDVLKDLLDYFSIKAAECEKLINYNVIPIKKLISVQLECGLLLMNKIRERVEK